MGSICTRNFLELLSDALSFNLTCGAFTVVKSISKLPSSRIQLWLFNWEVVRWATVLTKCTISGGLTNWRIVGLVIEFTVFSPTNKQNTKWVQRLFSQNFVQTPLELKFPGGLNETDFSKCLTV